MGRIGSRVGIAAGRIVAVAILMAWTTDAGGAASVQENPSPTAVEPGPGECLVEPRPLPLFPPVTPGAEPAATPLPLVEPTPFAVPEGKPADEATTAAIVATVRESLACRNGGDYPRAYALFTDRFLGELFGGPDTIPPEIASALENPPRPVRRVERLSLVAVSDVRLLADDRVGAVVRTSTAEETYDDYLIFVRGGDRWLLDERILLGEGATPSETS